ncbi:hypothetical protein GCM10009651_18700 [Microbacterium natoriense]
MKPIIPHMRLADYCAWVIFLVITGVALFFLLASASLGSDVRLGVLIVSAIDIAYVAVILTRNRRVRTYALELSLNKSVPAVAFDHAQMQNGLGQPLVDFEEGCISVRDGRVCVLRIPKGARDTPVASTYLTDVRDIRGEWAFMGCYPLLAIELSSGEVFRMRPLKPSGVTWRIGLTRKEIEAVIYRIYSTTGRE